MDSRTFLVTALPLMMAASACSNTSSNLSASEPDPLVKKAIVLNLAKNNGCFNCHGIDSAAVGPSWAQVSGKYHHDRNAKDKLIESVKYGSKDIWGDDLMPPSKGKIEDREIEQLVDYILALNE